MLRSGYKVVTVKYFEVKNRWKHSKIGDKMVDPQGTTNRLI